MRKITKNEIREILSTDLPQELFNSAKKIREEIYGKDVYIRGLIEISNYCRNDCLYCGIRKSNKKLERYRLSKDEILGCADNGYNAGFRTFVLQGGEDAFYSDEIMCDIIFTLKNKYPDCAVTLSVGEKNFETYKSYKIAGADRYLLRHETANPVHYIKLHPSSLSLENRKKCLYALKKLGFQVGSGFMVGSPFQTLENIAEDFIFLQELKPEMIGIGPFISHIDTPFANMKNGTLDLTLRCVALSRIILKNALIPSTTALGTIDKKGREAGLLCGANVVMPNLSPVCNRKKYMLYDNKLYSDAEAAEGLELLKKQIRAIGYEVKISRGDYKK